LTFRPRTPILQIRPVAQGFERILRRRPPPAGEAGRPTISGEAKPRSGPFAVDLRRYICLQPVCSQSIWEPPPRAIQPQRQRHDFSQHAAKRPPRQMTLRQEEPVETGVLYQAPAGWRVASPTRQLFPNRCGSARRQEHRDASEPVRKSRSQRGKGEKKRCAPASFPQTCLVSPAAGPDAGPRYSYT
jgi:hypothetical protein